MITPCDLPPAALLRKYDDGQSYTDSYCVEVGGDVPLVRLVTAFYTTPLFKLERFILKWLAQRPSTDRQAEEFAEGTADRFAAWVLEDRNEHQLLANAGRTRSWFMVEPVTRGEDVMVTRLYFGSAVVAADQSRDGRPNLGVLFTALLGFHKLYSRALLRAAMLRLARPES